jgi:hypothetical protein
LLWVGEEQASTETRLHPERRDEMFFDLMVSLLEALEANVELGYPGEHGSTAFSA